MNYNKEAKGLTFRRGSEVSQDKDSTSVMQGSIRVVWFRTGARVSIGHGFMLHSELPAAEI